MYKFQSKVTNLNFLTCVNLHMIKKILFIKQQSSILFSKKNTTFVPF